MQNVPNIHYFQSKNPFSGSEGLFRYRLEPTEEGLQVSAWFGEFCMEATDPALVSRQVFSMDEVGLHAALDWLEQAKAKQD